MSAAISAGVSPDILAGDAMNSAIAVDMPSVPAVEAIMPVLIMPPIDKEIRLPAYIPFITPSEASLTISATMAEENGMLSDLAYCDIAARVTP